MPTLISRICEHCSTQFTVLPAKKSQRYCSPGCVVSYRRSKSPCTTYTTCVNCNHDLSHKTGNKFCSKSCAATYNNKKRGPRSQKVKDNISKGVRNKLPLYSKVSWCTSCKQLIQNEWRRKCTACYAKQPILECKVSDLNLYPKNNHATINYASIFLQKDSRTVTYNDVAVFKNMIHTLLHVDNLSPNQIAEKFQIKHSNFGMFITKCLQIQLKDIKSAVKNTRIQTGTAKTDEKNIYFADCMFQLTQAEIEKIPGFDLMRSIGIYHPINNPNGAVRDHILSKYDGYMNGYDSKHIRHPANCRFITAHENNKKNRHSDITYEQLLERINLWEQDVAPTLRTTRRKITPSREHIEKIRAAINERYAKMARGELPNLKRKKKEKM